MSRNSDKGREAENAVAAHMQACGFPYAERRSKRGGHELIDGELVHRDAGDLTGIPGVVVQVKWSPYQPLDKMMHRTEQQRRVANACHGLLVVKRKGVGLARAGEWDTYLPVWSFAQLVDADGHHFWNDPVRVSLDTACALLRPAFGERLGVSA